MSALTSDWREERRRDREAAAQIRRDNDTARTQARITMAEAEARLRREERQARLADRNRDRKQRAVRRAEQMAWLSAHATDLLFIPVIAVPAVLAWTAMAAYGTSLYGPAGLALPALSEGGMWTFAGATTIARHRHPDKPLWHLRLGTAVFAAYGAALNFLHGMSAQHGLHGPGAAVVYALVSVAGVTAHQIITAGPGRSRAERDAGRLRRVQLRRERRIQRAARARAVAAIDPEGNARLLYQAGIVTLTRKHGRVRLADAPAPQLPAGPWPRPVPVLAAPAPDAARKAFAAITPEAAPGAAEGPSGEPRKGRGEVPPGMPSRKPDESHSGEPSGKPPADPRRRAAAISREPEAERARGAYRKSVRDGQPLSDRALGEMFGRSRTWGANRIRECNSGPHLAAKTG